MNREANPFVAASKIDFDGPFIGRKDDLKYIVLQMEAAQPTSINIVGDKKLGKSCLLYRFSQVWEHHLIGKSDKYVVIYLSCENVLESHENSFYQHIAENLCASSHVAKDSELFAAMQVDDWTRENFNRAIEKWKSLGVLPVLCLDDIESLLRNKSEFDNGFYDNLRYLMTGSKLMLIIASLKKLMVYSKKYNLTSSFFNAGHTHYLKHFNEEDVEKLLNTKDSSGKLALCVAEQHLARRWGNKHPYLLQLACFCLFKAKQLDEDRDWAYKEFKNQKDNVPNYKDKLWNWLGNIPWVGGYLKKAFNFIHDWFGKIITAMFIITVILFATGIVGWDEVEKFFLLPDKTG